MAIVALARILSVLISDRAPEERRTQSGEHPLPDATRPDPHDAPAGIVELDVSGAVLKVEAGAAAEPIRVEADYDASRFELSESFKAPPGAPWTYRLGFRRRQHFGFFGRNWGRNRLRLVLPRGVRIRLVGGVSTAESEFDLGGLTLSDVDLQLDAGDHEIAFREPLAQPLRSLSIQARGVELALLEVGNASPRRLEIEQRAGKFDLDLRGHWVADAAVYASCWVGEIDVVFPDDVALEVGGDLTVPAGLGVIGGAGAETAAPRVQAHFETRLCRERQRVR